jgi:hypothetical protein
MHHEQTPGLRTVCDTEPIFQGLEAIIDRMRRPRHQGCHLFRTEADGRSAK